MYRKIAVAGATAAAIIGVGTAALATSGPSTTGTGKSGSTSTSTGASAKHHAKKGKHGAKALLGHSVHGQVTTKGKDGYVTHSAIRGTVSAVSATSVTVKATDGFSQTFTISKDTKVRERPTSGKGKATAGKVSDLKQNAKVAVLGKAPEKSSAKPTATVVVDGLKK